MAAVLSNVLYTLRLRRRPTENRRSRAEVMASIPLRNSVVDWKKDDKGEVSLIIPADQKRILRVLVRVMDLPDKRVVALDAVGSYVWQQCDGEHTFSEVAQALASEFGMTRRESEASLAEFFRVLGKRGMLGFVVSEAAKNQIDASRRTKRRRGANSKRKPTGRKGR